MGRPTDWWVLDLSGDPVPGDPSTITQVARRWSQVADDADTARSQITSLLGDQAVMAWAGKGGDAFRSHSSKLPGQLQKCSDSYRQAAQALSTWSGQLDAHQQTADRALALGRAARDDLQAAQSQLSNAQGNASSAQSAVDGYTASSRQAAHDASVPAPDPAQVRAAVNRASAAHQAVSSAQHAVGDAQARLDAAKRLAAQAAAARDGDGRSTASKLHDAADAGIPPDSFWHKLGDALGKAWHILVEVAKVVVIIASVIAIVVGGPIAWVAFAAAMIILADTVAQYAQGKASLLDVGLAALGCIPGEGVLEDLSVVSKVAEDSNAVRQGTEDAVTAAHDLPGAEGGVEDVVTTSAEGAKVPEPVKEPAMAGGDSGGSGGGGGGGDEPPVGGDEPPVGGGGDDASPSDPLADVPDDAERRELTPTDDIAQGVEYKWTNENGQTVRHRVHTSDRSAPPGSNAAEGPVYRRQVGGRYVGPDGKLYPRGAFNPDSPNYDPEASNATHIPWPEGIPLPWER